MEQYFVPVPILCGTRDSSRAAHPTSRDSRQPPAKRDPTADSHTPYGSSGSRPLVDHHHRWWQARVHSTAATLPPLPPLAPSHCLVGAHRGSIGPPDTVTCRRRHSGWWWSVQDTQPRGRRARRLLSDGELSPRSSFHPAPSHPPHVLEADDEGQCPRSREFNRRSYIFGRPPSPHLRGCCKGGWGGKKRRERVGMENHVAKEDPPPPGAVRPSRLDPRCGGPAEGRGDPSESARARSLSRLIQTVGRGGGGWGCRVTCCDGWPVAWQPTRPLPPHPSPRPRAHGRRGCRPPPPPPSPAAPRPGQSARALSTGIHPQPGQPRRGCVGLGGCGSPPSSRPCGYPAPTERHLCAYLPFFRIRSGVWTSRPARCCLAD